MNKILASLNQQQKKAVTFAEGPLLVLAGAGSGKTRVITHRVAYLIAEKEVNPTEILCITFTNKAAQEMKNRIKKILQGKNAPFAGTFHSFCAKTLRIEGEAIGLSKNFVIWDRADQIAIVKKILKEAGEEKFSPASILSNISQAKNELVSPLKYVDFAQGPFQELVAQAYLGYQKELKSSNALDFDDLLGKAVYLFQKKPDVLQKYQSRYHYVFVDEYQDTNRAQYLLTKLLAKKSKNLCAVGDASQSIYSWRGADYRNINRIKKDFSNVTTINLERNYRSTQNILDAAYHVIVKNKSHPILKLWTQANEGDRIHFHQARSGKSEARFIVEKIAALTQQGYDRNDIAILYRTNAQSRLIEEAMLHYNLPYHLIGGFKFYERKEIKDSLAFLKYILNPADAASSERIEKIGKRLFTKIKRIQENLPQEIDQLPPPIEILDQTLKDSGYLAKYSPEKEDDRARLENIKELRSVALEFDDLSQFLENVALMEQDYFPNGQANFDQDNDQVTLMTLHAAKGTEYPVIFIAGIEEGLLPHSRSLDNWQDLEEERRLTYVGLTRAKEKLFLTCAAARLLYGRRQHNPVSRFIADIPEELINHSGSL